MREVLLVAVGLLVLPHGSAAQVVKYYHLDALGNVRAVTNQAGQIIERHDYLPFGEEWCGTGPCSSVAPGQPKRFTGKERDAETGLDYFGARYYGSKIGRFTTIDPQPNISRALVDPQRWNRYAYAVNNPLRYVDPDGKDPFFLWYPNEASRQAALQSSRDYMNAWINTAIGMWNATLGNPGHVKPEVQAELAAQSAPRTPGEAVWQPLTDAVAIAGPLALAEVARAGSTPRITEPYRRPSGATTAEQRAAVQGQPCIDCGTTAPKMFADHKTPLVKEYYETGKINETRMRDVGSVQPQCPTCSARQGAELSRYSAAKKKELSP